MAVRILLIEDNPGDALIFREKLTDSDLDFELVHTQRLEEGCEVVHQEAFDIILVDLSLPDASGLDAVVRVVEVAGDTPVVVLTGLDDAGMAAQARHEGAIDYLVKWYQDGPTMARYIRYAIAQRKMKRRGVWQAADAAQQGGGDSAPPESPEQDGVAAPTQQAPPTSNGLDPLRTALDASPDGIVIALANGAIEYANRQASGWIGNADVYPWSLRAGQLRIADREVRLTQQVTPTRWRDREAFVITLRSAGAAADDREGALIEAAEAAVGFLSQSERRVRWMTGLLRTMLDLEQQVRSDVQTAPTVINLVDALQTTVRDLRPLALERGIPIKVTANREKIATSVDRQLLDTLLHRVLLDCLLTAAGASVDVEAQVVDHEPRMSIAWELSVSDWAALPESARSLSRRVLEELVNRAGGQCRFEQDGQRDIVRFTLRPPG